MTDFTAETYQNEYLAAGPSHVDALVSVAVRQRRAQTPQLFEQSLTSAAVDRLARRRRAGARQIGDGSHEQRMIISHEASAQPLPARRRAGVP